MNNPVLILYLEDSPRDAELVRDKLQQVAMPLELRVAINRAEYEAALAQTRFDLILSDYALPNYDGMAALALAREKQPDVPFILISGTLGEERAVDCVVRGATDYVLKQNLNRLVPAVLRALTEAEEHRKRRVAEDALRQSEERFRVLFEQAADSILLLEIRPEGPPVIRDANSTTTKLLGFERDELIGQPVSLIDVGADAPETIERRRQDILSGSGRLFETQHRHKDGTILDFECSVAEMIIGSKTYALSVERNITARKQAEERLRMTAHMLDAAPTSIVVHDMDGRILYGNRQACELHGCSPEEFLGRNVQDQLPADDPLFLTRIRQIQEAGQASFEVAHLRQDGATIPLHIRAHMTEWEGNPAVLSVQIDLTERRKAEKALREAEEQFRQVQKLEAVGQLAGGVAHDFNNILMAQLGYCELMRGGLKDEDPLAKDLAQIKACAERAAGLTRQLLAFSRKQALQPRVLDLNAVVGDIEKMLRRLIGEDIDFVTKLSADLGRVQADPGQIEQVIMNLVVNARDAMPNGGKLTIETGNVDLDEEYARSHVSVVPGRYAMLAVSDTGCGMDAATKSRIFEPFFTTKGKDKGTGLGLATVYGIVKQSGGNIWAYSELGKGTSFKIFLPRVDAEPAPQVSQAVAVVRGSGELVLVVEDEPSIQDLLARMLGNLGYQLRVAANGAEALIAVEKEGLKPDLLITDTVMPGMSGRVLAERLRQIQPGLKVLYMSGYTDNAIVHHGVLDPGTPFLQKPFNMGALAGKVREVLGTK
jgi:two-component system cell cycle sensor histidine kinase/response regulator CckA